MHTENDYASLWSILAAHGITPVISQHRWLIEGRIELDPARGYYRTTTAFKEIRHLPVQEVAAGLLDALEYKAQQPKATYTLSDLTASGVLTDKHDELNTRRHQREPEENYHPCCNSRCEALVTSHCAGPCTRPVCQGRECSEPCRGGCGAVFCLLCSLDTEYCRDCSSKSTVPANRGSYR